MTTSYYANPNASFRASNILDDYGYSFVKSCPASCFFICSSTWNGSLCFRSPLTSLPFYPWPSQTEKKWQCFNPIIWGDVIYASWLVLYGLCAAIPPFVANENLVTTFEILYGWLLICDLLLCLFNYIVTGDFFT